MTVTPPTPRAPHHRRTIVTVVAILAAIVVGVGGWPIAPGVATAQDDTSVVYAVRILEPFVIEAPDGSLTGFSIDLAREIARSAGDDIEFVVVESVQEQLAAVEDGRADAAIGAISITADREARVDFSQPMYDSGIQIAVRAASDRISLGSIMRELFDPSIALLLGGVAVATLVTGIVVWLLERRRNPDFDAAGWRGVFGGVWWATVTLFTIGYGDQVPRRIASRVIAIVWMLAGVLVVATLTAEVTANVTVDRIESGIDDVGDLAGRDVVTVEGTTSDDYLRLNGVEAEPMPDPTVAVRAVERGDADALVYDAAIIRYLVNDDADIRAAGPVLQPESYGIVLPEGSPRVEAIDRALLTVRENGVYDRLESAYFG